MLDLVYRVEKSRRKTISLLVREGKVIVRAPYGMADEAIGRFVREHEKWIASKLFDAEKISSKFCAVKEGRSLLIDGIEHALVLGARRNRGENGVVYLKNLKSMHGFFEKTRSFLLVEKTALLSKSVGLFPNDVAVRDFKARWGSCDAEHAIKLNWRLSMLPTDLQEYVIVHELCHIAHLDHSPAFWREVEKVLPDQAARKKRLKEFSFLTLLYR